MTSALLTKVAALFAPGKFAPGNNTGSRGLGARRFFSRIAFLFAIIVAGSYGVALPMQTSIEREIGFFFPIIQAALGTTTHDPVDIDVWNRTLKINQFTFRSDTQPEILLKIASIEVSGLGIGPGLLTADRVVIDGLELEYSGRQPNQPGFGFVYKVPEVVVDGFSTPVKEFPAANSMDAIGIVRLALERLAESTATSVSIPAVWITTKPSLSPGASADTTEQTLFNLVIRDLRAGRLAAITVDRIISLGAPVASGRGRVATEIGRISVNDLQLPSLLAAIAPAASANNAFMSLFREAAVGSYAGTRPNGHTVNIGSFSVSEFALRPSAVNLEQFDTVADLAASADRTQSPIQQRNLADQIAALLTGLRIGQIEVHGMKTNSVTDGPVELANLRLKGLDNGRISDFILEDLYAPRLKDPLRVGRIAFTSVDIAGLIRKSAQLATLQDPPSPDQIAGLMPTIEGIEVSEFSVPDKDTGQFIRLETFSASWGQFVGDVPGTVKITARAALPVSGADNSPLKALADVGFRMLWLSFDASAAWMEADQSISFPVQVTFDGLFSASGIFAINNVTRRHFEPDSTKFGDAANDLEAGPVVLSLRDTGGLDLLIAHFAKTQGVSLEAARRGIKENIDRAILVQPQASAELQRLADALGRFATTRGATLKVSIAPRQRVNLMELADMLDIDPLRALSQFSLELSVDR